MCSCKWVECAIATVKRIEWTKIWKYETLRHVILLEIFFENDICQRCLMYMQQYLSRSLYPHGTSSPLAMLQLRRFRFGLDDCYELEYKRHTLWNVNSPYTLSRWKKKVNIEDRSFFSRKLDHWPHWLAVFFCLIIVTLLQNKNK